MFKRVKPKRGIILMYVVLWSLSVATLVFVFVNSHLSDQRFFRDAENENQALWLAYGGLHKGIQKISQNPQFLGILDPEDINSGKIRVKILLKEGKTIIHSEGSYHGVTMEAEKEVHF